MGDSERRRDRLSLPARGLRSCVRAYQFVFSWRSSPCRYVPSCSVYAIEAIEIHGAARGSWLAVRRVGRCHPWGAHGWDPVPGWSNPAVTPSSTVGSHDCRSADSGRDDVVIASAGVTGHSLGSPSLGVATPLRRQTS